MGIRYDMPCFANDFLDSLSTGRVGISKRYRHSTIDKVSLVAALPKTRDDPVADQRPAIHKNEQQQFAR
jgi:hypothetical protein